MIRVLFVCLGNICRSPMAQFVFQNLVHDKGLNGEFEIDSAGTDAYNEIYHIGIHPRTKEMLQSMHIPFTEHFARPMAPKDYRYFDYILCMDSSNIIGIKEIIGGDSKNKIHRLLDFIKHPRDIKDPWYTGNFDEAYWDIVEGCEAFLDYLNGL